MKTFLSQTDVPWAWALKQGLGDPYVLHQWIWKALPDDPDARRDFLFRSDVKGGILRVLLLSERIPVSRGDSEWKTTEMSDTFLGHGTYRFRLRANPTFRRASDHRRLAIFDETKIREWFARKFADAGCELRDLETTAPRKLRIPPGNSLRRRCVRNARRPGRGGVPRRVRRRHRPRQGLRLRTSPSPTHPTLNNKPNKENIP